MSSEVGRDVDGAHVDGDYYEIHVDGGDYCVHADGDYDDVYDGSSFADDDLYSLPNHLQFNKKKLILGLIFP